MWTMLLSLEPIVEVLRPAFTLPSFAVGCRVTGTGCSVFASAEVLYNWAPAS